MACFNAKFLLLACATMLTIEHVLAKASQHVKRHRNKGSQASLGGGLITQLPGLTYHAGFRQYSGYLTVSKEHERNIFYWYLESQHKPATDPLVLWTNGGPGCSGLMGLLEEHGPFIIDENMQLSPNPFSWNTVANMLYIEQPAGVGFSFSKNTSDYMTGDAEAARDNYQLILEFFKRYPERRSNGFYIASESYGGHYIPQLALEILERNALDGGKINLKGMLIGNPAVDFFHRTQFQVSTLYFHGLIPQDIFTKWSRHCNTLPKFNTLKIFWSAVMMPGEGILPHAMNYPVCTEQQAQLASSSRHHHLKSSSMSLQALHLNRRQHSNVQPVFARPSNVYQPCASLRANEYLNRDDVRRALHVHEQWSTKNWIKCSDNIHYRTADHFHDVTFLYQQLVNMAKAHHHTLNMLIYSGDDDSICGTAGTQFWIWGLGVNGKSNQTWVPWTVDDQTAGYVTHFELGDHARAKFTFVTVHGAGHEVPSYRPKEALVMFQKYLNGEW